MRFSWPRALSNALALATLLLDASAAAQNAPRRFHDNPLRARQAGELARRELFPNQPDGGLDDDAGGVLVGGYEFWWIGSVSPADISIVNSGVQAVMQEVDAAPVGGGCFACWTSEYLDNGMWGQIGFSACELPGRDPSTVTFYQIWDTGSSPEALLVDANSDVSSPGIHTYAMNVENGTTWAYSVDGTVMGTYDMGSAISTNLGALATMCEEGDGVLEPFAPNAVSAPIAMQALNDGTWTGAPSADVFNSANLSGVAGHLQDSSLPAGAILIGGDSSYYSSGTMLWDGPTAGFAPDAGPAGESALAPPRVSLMLPTSNSTVAGTVEIYGTVSNPPTAPAIAEVNLFVEDLMGVRQAAWSLQDPPYDVDWFTTGLPNQRYLVFMQVIDALGRQTYMDIEVALDNQSGTTSGGTGAGGASTTSGTGSGPTGPVYGSTSGGNTRGSPSGSGTGMNGSGSRPGSSAGGCSTAEGTISPLLLLPALARRRNRRFASSRDRWFSSRAGRVQGAPGPQNRSVHVVRKDFGVA